MFKKKLLLATALLVLGAIALPTTMDAGIMRGSKGHKRYENMSEKSKMRKQEMKHYRDSKDLEKKDHMGMKLNKSNMNGYKMGK